MTRILAFVVFLLLPVSVRASVVYYLAAAPENEVQSLATKPNGLRQLLYSKGPERLYLDKAWHGVHWLFARSAGSTDAPLSKVILGGKDFGPDLGLGRARHFTSAEVVDIAALLTKISPDDLKKNYDPKAMDAAQIYPDDWVEWERSGENALEMLLAAFRDLRDFYVRAAKAGHAVIYAWG